MKMNQQLEEVLEEVRALPDERQCEIAEVLLAFLDQHDLDLYLSPEQIAEVETLGSANGPYATEEEGRAEFARLTGMSLRWEARALTELRMMYGFLSRDDPAAAKRMVNWLEEATGRLLIIPKSSRPDMMDRVRILAVPGAPYVVVYRVSRDVVDILGMVYTTRRRCG